MHLSPQKLAARISYPLASASPSRSVHPRGVGGSLSQDGFACPKSGTSHWALTNSMDAGKALHGIKEIRPRI
jgi:hypothetical protein